MKLPKTALIGIGGVGRAHANALRELALEKRLTVEAFAEIRLEQNADTRDSLTGLGDHAYVDYREMLARHPDIEAVIIATPIATHKRIACDVLNQGFHVLLEKPPAAVIQDFDEIVSTHSASGKLCGVMFQNTSGKAFRKLLAELEAGALGRLHSVRGIGIWKRTRSYYERTPWAGKLTHNGEFVLDGTLMNPFAHLLHNCLLAAASGRPELTAPRQIQAELYRGHPIESEDTASLRLQLDNGTEVLLHTTLCAEENEVPYIELFGSRGSAKWTYNNELFMQPADGGETKVYSPGPEDGFRSMILDFVQTVAGEKPEPYAPLETCRNFMIAANGAFESAGRIQAVPDRFLEITPIGDDERTCIRDISPILHQVHKEGRLLSELGLPWASAGDVKALAGYDRFSPPWAK